MRLFISLFMLLLLGACTSPECEKTQVLESAPTLPKEAALQLQLNEVEILSPRRLKLKMTMKNISDEKLVFYERWNSWGAWQWAFEVENASGEKMAFSNPQMIWSMNYPSTMTLEPGQTFSMPCVLDLDDRRSSSAKQWRFSPYGIATGAGAGIMNKPLSDSVEIDFEQVRRDSELFNKQHKAFRFEKALKIRCTFTPAPAEDSLGISKEKTSAFPALTVELKLK